MRIKVSEYSDTSKVYGSLKEACDALGKAKFKQLVKEKKVERLYEKGYWNALDAECLKEFGRRRREGTRCLIQD